MADTEQHARMGAQRVQIEYEDLPSIISCEDAIEANSYFEVQTAIPAWIHHMKCLAQDKAATVLWNGVHPAGPINPLHSVCRDLHGLADVVKNLSIHSRACLACTCGPCQDIILVVG